MCDLKTALQRKLRLYKRSSAECDIIPSSVSRNLIEAKKFSFFNNKLQFQDTRYVWSKNQFIFFV